VIDNLLVSKDRNHRSQPAAHKRPFELYPVPVLGAVCPLLEPFRGHLSPKVIKIFKNCFD
jgi:hypothetical protein